MTVDTFISLDILMVAGYKDTTNSWIARNLWIDKWVFFGGRGEFRLLLFAKDDKLKLVVALFMW